MHALVRLYGWTPLAFDIKEAYFDAAVAPREAIPIRFEPELQTYNEAGEPTYRRSRAGPDLPARGLHQLLERNLYLESSNGSPAEFGQGGAFERCTY